MFWCFKSCSRCIGDLVFEDDLWRCMQCGHYYYPNAAPPLDSSAEGPEPETEPAGGPRRRRARTQCGGIAGRNINAMIKGNNASRERWWERNRQVIAYVGEGRTVPEIAGLTALGKRQIREVKQTLKDLWAQAGDGDKGAS